MSEPSVPIKITCPECQGCISLDIEPHAGILTYRCQVGHAYSIKEMIKGKEVQVENTLWTTVGLFEHLEMLYEKLLNEQTEVKNLGDEDIECIRTRLKRIAEHKQVLFRVTEDNTPPPLNDGD